jgi:tetratricopeptide (TPR) repeat protein
MGEPEPSRTHAEADAAVAALLAEYLAALEAGESPDRAEFLARCPDGGAELAVCLDGLDFLHRVAPQVAQGTQDEPEPEPATPIALGDFRVVRELGRGGMGIVYEAEQLSLGRRVALKVLPFAAVLDARRLQRFRNEAQAAAHLHHPNIVPVYAVGCERGVHYYAMQLVDGTTIERVVDEMRALARGHDDSLTGTAPSSGRAALGASFGASFGAVEGHETAAYARAVARLGVQAANALEHAHQQGVVHRDVKPGNLMLDGNGTLWVTDFGLAMAQGDATALTRAGDLVGTLRYMSPELATAGRLPVDHRTDVYSLGATLYEMLGLEPPFPGDDAHELLRALAADEPLPLRRRNRAVPEQLETVLAKAMAKSPADRYASAAAFAEDLSRFLDDRPVLARRPSAGVRLAKWAKRHRAFVASSAVVAAIGLAALGVTTWRVSQEERATRDALDLSERNLGLAQQAVEKFLVESGLAGSEDMPLPSPGQRALLETALRFYARVPGLRNAAGAPESRVNILHALHRYDEAHALFQRALATAPSDPWLLTWDAHFLWHLGRLDEALAKIDAAVAGDPTSAEAWQMKASIESSRGDTQASLASLERALAIDPRRPGALCNQGLDLVALGRRADALACFDAVLKVAPNWVSAHVGRGQVLLDQNDVEGSLAAYDRAVALAPGRARGHDGRGQALRDAGRIAEAVAAHRRAIEVDADYAPAYTNLGTALEKAGKPDEAIAMHREALRRDEHLVDARANLGMTLVRAGRVEEGIAEIQRVVAARPKDAGARFELGCAYDDAGDPAKAEAAYREAVALDPKHAKSYCNLGGILESRRDTAGALVQFRAAVAADKDLPEGHAGVGNSLMRLGKVDEAMAEFKEVTRLKPGYANGWYCTGHALYKLGQHRAAIENFRRAQARDPSMGDAWFAEGLSWMRLHDLEAAARAFQNAIARMRRPAQAYGALGEALGDLGKTDEAIASLQKALRLEPRNPEVLATLGRVLTDAGRAREGAEECQKAIRLDGEMAEAHQNLANALGELEDWAGSEKAAREALRLQKDFSLAHNTLGIALVHLGRRPDGIAQYRESIRLDPSFGPAHLNLAKALLDDGHEAEALQSYADAIAAEPTLPEAHLGLGRALERMGEYRASLPWLRRGHALGIAQPRWTRPSAEWLAEAERRAALEERLDAALRGADAPKDDAERLAFAEVLRAKKRYAECARMCERATSEGARFEAARAAALASAREPDAAAWRGRALASLRADLSSRASSPPEVALAVERWRTEPDLAPVRDRLADLPETERAAWRAFWGEVDAFLARVPRPRK